MIIRLLNPSSSWYTGLVFRMNPGLGLPILSAVLNNAGHVCGVEDLEALSVHPDALRSRMAQQPRPDVIGLTALTLSAHGAQDTIRTLKEFYTGKVVVGGVVATISPEEVLAWGADAVITGECEGNVVELFERIAAGETGIFQGIPTPIESIPAPDWAHHNPHPTSYGGNAPKVGHPEGIFMGSRGCPWRCTYCGNSIFGKQATRYRPPANIEAELRTLKDMGINALFDYSDEEIGGPIPDGWMQELADRISPLGFAWKAQGRCSRKHITPQLLADIHRAGCKAIMWGVESFSPNVLNAARKGTSPDDIWHTLRLSKEAGIANFLFTMVGNYKETEDDLAITADCLQKAYQEGLVQYRQTTIVTALPGTELWDIQKREGWWHPVPEDGPPMHQAYQPTPWLSVNQINYWRAKFAEVCPVGF